MLTGDLKGLSFADVLERREAGQIGDPAAMDWLGAKTYDELVRTMHFNDRQMPGHRAMIVTPETKALLPGITRRHRKA